MQEQKKILFVINPISGGKKKTAFNKKVLEVLDMQKFKPTFQQTTRPNHAYELGKMAIEEGYDAVVAVGGDGTINELGSALVGSGIPMGIIPEGSGNGLALYLGVPMNETSAINRLNRFETVDVDCGIINEKPFFNIAGLGFDATVSDRFANDSIRGPIGYLRSVINVISKYKPCKYELTIDGKLYEREAFMISVANSPQYGNNAYIAPNASVNDGVLDVCIVHKFPLYILPMMVFHLFNRSADQSEYVEIIPGKDINIKRLDAGPIHVDGEPVNMANDLNIIVKPKALKIIC
ncbi:MULTISPECIES: diacylglycerol/lipid kinase family protein [Sphingobacterium]|uniref:Diacylglycerol kinase family lipid kinase n=1 Tax=Sphingobacterium litopenaei TaxID=2763500 RepID=A0ABR7YDA4_9SPHI|nr:MULTISPECIES: diacylglycerol kinase family protein [Sphingobacterium]MBD1429295.1 diacylglycerol kinase family lipid kinase [Sphingobacterium litopenaei]NGM73589.1 diacylglycerol kinase family lipid kinase [Sphingobacterium sp. SGL-16]